MTDNLRDRIAAVAQNHVRCDDCTFAKTPQQRYLHFADAVIRELGLKRMEMGEWDVLAQGFRGFRYVTPWDVDDE